MNPLFRAGGLQIFLPFPLPRFLYLEKPTGRRDVQALISRYNLPWPLAPANLFAVTHCWRLPRCDVHGVAAAAVSIVKAWVVITSFGQHTTTTGSDSNTAAAELQHLMTLQRYSTCSNKQNCYRANRTIPGQTLPRGL